MAEDAWYFFTDADRARMRAAAATPWGASIEAALRRTVAERLQHDMTVPAGEAGHFHHYFCPEHKRLLEFRWESPRAHYCAECDAELTGEKYDYAWIVFVHNHNLRYMQACRSLSVITGEAVHRERIRDLLLDYAAKYPHYKHHGHDMQPDAWYGGRMSSQTLDEGVWASEVAAAYHEALPVIAPAQRQTIETGLWRPMAATLLGNPARGNWQMWHNAGLAAIAVALGDAELLDTAINKPVNGYQDMIDSSVTREGWWDERSPGYHFYPLHAMVLTAEAVRCRGIELYDERLRRMFDAPLECVYADLSFPAHNDGWHGVSLRGQAALYEVAALRFAAPRYTEMLSRAYAGGERKSWFALLNGHTIAPNPAPLMLSSTCQPDAGAAYLRAASRTAVLKFGPHGGGHGHPDKLSLTIHNGARELLPDLGTPGYGVPDYTQWYRRTVAHSTVVVDASDQQEAAGTLLAFEARPDGGRVVAGCDTAYPGVSMERTVSLAGDTVRDAFVCAADSERLFDYVLILVDPVAVPADAEPVELEGAGYSRIERARRWPAPSHAAFAVPGATLTLTLPPFAELINGQAPGIPGAFNKVSTFAPCYPLIVRVRARAMEVRAEWVLTE